MNTHTLSAFAMLTCTALATGCVEGTTAEDAGFPEEHRLAVGSSVELSFGYGESCGAGTFGLYTCETNERQTFTDVRIADEEVVAFDYPSGEHYLRLFRAVSVGETDVSFFEGSRDESVEHVVRFVVSEVDRVDLSFEPLTLARSSSPTRHGLYDTTIAVHARAFSEGPGPWAKNFVFDDGADAERPVSSQALFRCL